MALRAIHVGVGGRGVWPLKRFKERDDFASVALVDVNEQNLAAACEATGLGEDVCFADMKEAMAKVEADVVVVITPPQLHHKQCQEAVRAGKHVLVEKPFTMDLAQAREVVDEAEKAGVKVCVTQNARYSPGNVTLARMVREEVYGKPGFGQMVKYGWRPRTHHSGGQRHSYLWERGIHDLDTMRAVFNSEVVKVSGRSFNPTWSPYNHGAGAAAWLEFDNGATCGYFCTFAAPGKGGSSFRIDCEKATLEDGGKQILVTPSGSKDTEGVPVDEAPAAEVVLLDGFARYIAEGTEPPFSGRQNLRTVALVEAVGRASDEDAVIDPSAI
ncbi:MAG: Gfo/Idh/MocA family oxidoreductase [Planctomycetes bacterium]|nr:Gfo/Idh/MocA family oxidoreductase [Planctomycetota bacterium]